MNNLNIVNKDFVQTMRAVEHSLGIPNSYPGLISDNTGTSMNVTAAIATTARSSSLTSEIRQALEEAIPIFTEIALGLKVNIVFDQNGLRSRLAGGSPLVAKYGLNSEFFSAHRVDHDDFTALWMLAGSTIILLTQLMQPWDRKHTIIIYITRKFELLFWLYNNLILFRFGVCFRQLFSNPTSDLMTTFLGCCG